MWFAGATLPTLGCTPAICRGLEDSIVCPTGVSTLTTSAVDPRRTAPPLTYQWNIEQAAGWSDLGDGALAYNGQNVGTISGAHTASLTFTAMALTAGQNITIPMRFRCDVSNTCGHTISAPVRITICRADVNCSGTVSVQDVFDFIGFHFGGDPRADFNGVGGITVQDIFDFLAAYFAGCG